ncbi:MAG: hypothetical protein QMC67_10235 [Candidatus Wallbacteria bacterium]|mgnify:CR=1 FL=1
MSLFDVVKNITNTDFSDTAEKPLPLKYSCSSLKDAYCSQLAPASPGVYKLYLNGQLMKVGKAADGLRKRFSDYYRGVVGGTAGLKHINEANRDIIIAVWVECETSQCRDLELKLYREAEMRGEKMPWSERK